jgi:hypothetical protein
VRNIQSFVALAHPKETALVHLTLKVAVLKIGQKVVRKARCITKSEKCIMSSVNYRNSSSI